MRLEELKERQSVMWGIGPCQRITETLTDAVPAGEAAQLALRPGRPERVRERLGDAFAFFDGKYSPNGEVKGTRR